MNKNKISDISGIPDQELNKEISFYANDIFKILHFAIAVNQLCTKYDPEGNNFIYKNETLTSFNHIIADLSNEIINTTEKLCRSI